jgi:hypothetical protein
MTHAPAQPTPTRWIVATGVLLGLAVATRTVRWAVGFPLWGDEALFALNLVGRGFGDLLAPMSWGQVVPGGFLLGEIALHQWVGPAERSLRFLPFAAGLASVWFFHRLGRVVLGRVPGLAAPAALVPLAVFAVAYYPIRYGSEIKPYSVDLCMSAALLWLGARILTAPEPGEGNRRLLRLALWVAPALWLSYPAVFVASGLALVLLFGVRANPGRLAALFVYSVSLAANFLGSYLVVGVRHLALGTRQGEILRTFWAESFPPLNPLKLLPWLVDTHTGMMFAYPNGGRDGGSTVTFLLFLVGAWALWRAVRGRELLLLLLVPFALAMLASALRLYPYGGHPRLSLYLAPSICLLAGLGAATLLSRLRSRPVRDRVSVALLLLLGVSGVVGMARDVAEPYRSESHLQAKQLARELSLESDDSVVVCLTPRDRLMQYRGPGARFRWYLEVFAGDRLRYGEDGLSADGLNGRVVAVSYGSGGVSHADAELSEWIQRDAPGITLESEESVCIREDCSEQVRIFRLAG